MPVSYKIYISLFFFIANRMKYKIEIQRNHSAVARRISFMVFLSPFSKINEKKSSIINIIVMRLSKKYGEKNAVKTGKKFFFVLSSCRYFPLSPDRVKRHHIETIHNICIMSNIK